MILNDMLQEFLFQKELAGLSKQSLKDYENILQIFVDYAGKELHLEMITYSLATQYIKYLMGKGLAKATLATYIRNFRIFLKWISVEYGLSFDYQKIKIPKTPKKLVNLLNDSDIAFLFSSIDNSISIPWIAARNKAIIALMLDSGLRQLEVCSLLKCNINAEKMALKVTGKGAKERFVPLGNMSLYFLKEYIKVCPVHDSPYVFIARLGNPITTTTVKVFMNHLKHDTGLDLSSHKLRHNFATNYCIDNLRETGNSNTYDLSILMGHESIETTKKYEHFAHSLIALENRHSHLDKVFSK